MKLEADRLLPVALGALPIAVVIGLALAIMTLGLGQANPSALTTPSSPPLAVDPGGSNLPSSSTAPAPPQQGDPGGQGFCIPILGCL